MPRRTAVWPLLVPWIAVLLMVVALAFAAGSRYAQDHQRQQRIEEDDPRWDCRHDGNRICGSEATR